MGTRAMYSFTTGNETYHVYKHWDGYPQGAAKFIEKALPYAWPLPRFEPDEFACAFIAGNKKAADPKKDPYGQGGDIRLMESGDWRSVAPRDLEYRYEISAPDGVLHVRAWAICYMSADSQDSTLPPSGLGAWREKLLYDGPQADFADLLRVREMAAQNSD